MRTNIESLDWNLGNINNSRGRDGRKTIDDVFDEATLKNIQQLFHRGIISTLENIIATPNVTIPHNHIPCKKSKNKK